MERLGTDTLYGTVAWRKLTGAILGHPPEGLAQGFALLSAVVPSLLVIQRSAAQEQLAGHCYAKTLQQAATLCRGRRDTVSCPMQWRLPKVVRRVLLTDAGLTVTVPMGTQCGERAFSAQLQYGTGARQTQAAAGTVHPMAHRTGSCFHL